MLRVDTVAVKSVLPSFRVPYVIVPVVVIAEEPLSIDPNPEVIDPESNVKNAAKRLEMRIETLGIDGRVSASAERVGQVDGHRISMINLLQEWGNMLSALTSPHEATNRRIYGLPDEFHEERPAMMNLHSDESE